MKTRAAVAYEAGKPLVIEDVELEGPKAGEVLVEIKATGVCHTDEFTLLGRRSRGAVPGHPRARRRGRRASTSAPGVTSVQPGDHVIPLYTPECRAVQIVPQPQDQPVHGDPRDAGQGPDARRHQPLLASAEPADPSLHGLLDVREAHRAAGDRAREDPPRRAVRQGLLHRLRRHHRHRRGVVHGEGRRRAPTSSCSASAASA